MFKGRRLNFSNRRGEGNSSNSSETRSSPDQTQNRRRKKTGRFLHKKQKNQNTQNSQHSNQTNYTGTSNGINTDKHNIITHDQQGDGNHRCKYSEHSSSSIGRESNHNGPADLSNFDACVEACDALAAGTSGKLNDQYLDCSVMVSPDGILLFVPKKNKAEYDGSNGHANNPNNDQLEKETVTESNDMKIDESTEDPAGSKNDENETKNIENETNTSSAIVAATSAPPVLEDDLAKLSHEFFSCEEYESAVVMGRDLKNGADKDQNGFSAKGWNPDCTSVAIRRSESTLVAITKFLEDLIIAKKTGDVSISQACDQLRDCTGLESTYRMNKHTTERGSLGSDNEDTKVTEKETKTLSSAIIGNSSCFGSHKNVVTDNVNPKNSNIDDTQHNLSRLGPLVFPGTSLHKALVALEQYYVKTSEADALKWRKASTCNDCNKTPSSPIQNTRGDAMLPNLINATNKTRIRAEMRERALHDAQARVDEAEKLLREKKQIAQQRWNLVNDTEAEIQKRVEEVTRMRSRQREMDRQLQLNKRQEMIQKEISSAELQSTVTQHEIWELIGQVSIDADYAPTGLPTPRLAGPIDLSLDTDSENLDNNDIGDVDHNSYSGRDFYLDARADIEDEIDFTNIRMAAMEAQEDVEDAAGTLLTALSKLDTTKRSARIAAEGCLLSAANTHAKFIKHMMRLEKESIYERLKLINELEKDIDSIDVRSDLDHFIGYEKNTLPHGRTRLGEDDDGGVASALAVLNCHSEGAGVGVGVASSAEDMSNFSGWEDVGESNNDEVKMAVIDREDIENAVMTIFEENNDIKEKHDDMNRERRERALYHLENNVNFLVDAVKQNSLCARGYRASVCYAINHQRGINTCLHSEEQFNGLCEILYSLLTGCDKEAADIANAKLCMILAQTFYYAKNGSGNGEKGRQERVYAKIKLISHPIWSDEEFWVQALFQCVTESLTNSGVMNNFERPSNLDETKKDRRTKQGVVKIKWYDLSVDERAEAASQVHAVIFAQLGALAHSMIEFGCTLEQSCAFIRRISIRHQLPLSQRSILLEHIIKQNQEMMKK